MTKFIVCYRHNNNDFYLRSTVWSSALDRAQKFDEIEEAKAAIAKRHKVVAFGGMPKKQIKHEQATIVIREVEA